jgi:hypothetical protein
MDKTKDMLSNFDSLKNIVPFKTPDNYFDTILPRVQEKISEERPIEKNLKWIFVPKPLIVIGLYAVGIAFIVFLSISVILPFWQEKNTFKPEEISRYLNNQAFTIDDATLTAEFDFKPNELSTGNVEKNDTINFLLNSNIDSDDIYDEL